MKLSIIPFILNKIKSGLGIVQDTDTATQAIANGKYVFWKGSVKKASSAISENDTLSASNLSDVTDGALNAISDQIATKVDKSAIANNLTTTSEGSVLDARQGKSIADYLPRYVSKTVSYKNKTTNLEKVASVTIPAGYVYALFFHAEYTHGNPREVMCLANSSSNADYNYLGTGIAKMSVNGYASSATTLNFYCRRQAVPDGANNHNIHGFIAKAYAKYTL